MLHGGVARSTTQVVACQSIRYQVYCGERGFLRGEDYPEARESDEFDGIATHLAVMEGCGTLLGTARIVRHSSLGFPLQRYCEVKIPEKIEPTTGEVSRLAVPKAIGAQYSRSSTGCLSRDVALRLYQTIYHIAKQEGLTHLIAAMAPSLVRVLGAFDMTWSPIGPAAMFGGAVRPYLCSFAAFDSVKTEAALRFRCMSTATPANVNVNLNVTANANTV